MILDVLLKSVKLEAMRALVAPPIMVLVPGRYMYKELNAAGIFEQ